MLTHKITMKVLLNFRIALNNCFSWLMSPNSRNEILFWFVLLMAFNRTTIKDWWLMNISSLKSIAIEVANRLMKTVFDLGNSRRPSRPPSVATLIQDKPYVCPRCGRCYSRRGALIQHQRYECGVEPQFSCPMCPYKIKRKDSLNRHIRNMHHNQSNSWSLNQALC